MSEKPRSLSQNALLWVLLGAFDEYREKREARKQPLPTHDSIDLFCRCYESKIVPWWRADKVIVRSGGYYANALWFHPLGPELRHATMLEF